MKTILILEDDLDLATHWQEHLEDAGHCAIHASDFAAATSVLDTKEVHLVISDMLIRVGGEVIKRDGGISLMSHINLHVRPRPWVIAVSGAHPDLNVLGHAKVMKAVKTFSKPVDVSELVGAVAELIDQQPPPY